MIGVEVRSRRDDILKKLQDEKILAIPAAENVVRFLPPYVIRESHIDDALAKLAGILSGLSPGSSPPCAAS